MQLPDAARPSSPSPSVRPSVPATPAPPAAPPDRVEPSPPSAPFVPSAQQVAQLFKGQSKHGPSPVVWSTDPTTAAPRGMLPSPDGAVVDVAGQQLVKRDASGAVAWTVTLDQPLQPKTAAACVANDGTVAVTTEDHVMRALDPSTGAERWRLDLGEKFAEPATAGADGSLLVFRKIGDDLCLSRVATDGKVLHDVTLGLADKPIGDGGNDIEIVAQDASGRVLVHGTALFPFEGQARPSMRGATWSVLPDGTVESRAFMMETPGAFAGDPDRYYHADYNSMAAFDRHTGEEVWKMDKPHVGFDRQIGPYGDTLFKLGGEHKYKYVKLFDAAPGRFYVQGYIERDFRTAEELLCLDAADPQTVVWKHPTEGSVFRGPLFVDPDLVVHVAERDSCTIEAVDPKTGAALWKRPMKDAEAGQRELGPADTPGFVRVSRESADNYRVTRAPDGTLFVRTYKQIVGLDPATGEVRSLTRSEHEVGTFALAPDGQTVLTTDAETGSLRALEIETPALADQREADRLAEEARNAPTPPTISVEDEWITIGSVKVPRNSG